MRGVNFGALGFLRGFWGFFGLGRAVSEFKDLGSLGFGVLGFKGCRNALKTIFYCFRLVSQGFSSECLGL